MDADIVASCIRLGELMVPRGGRLVTVESCTGGGVAWHITAVPGSSDWFDRALVTYSNAAKMELVGVPASTLADHGAVSEQTAIAMATGGLHINGVSHAVSVTGVAGPGGGSRDKPVGMVCFAWACREDGEVRVLSQETCQFDGDREAIRLASIRHVLARLIDLVDD